MDIAVDGKMITVDYDKWRGSLEVLFEDATMVYSELDLSSTALKSTVLKFDQHDNLIGFKIEDLAEALKSLSGAGPE